MMDAAYNKDMAVVVLDRSEVRLIMKALDVLRYSDEKMNGSMLINLAGLSHEWLCMTQAISSPNKYMVSPDADIDLVMDKYIRHLYGPERSFTT